MRNLLLVFLLSLCSLLQAQQGEYLYYEVKAGDTKYSITRQYGITEAELEKYNPDVKSGLKPSMVLLIPKKKAKANAQEKFKKHKVVQGETLYSISQQYGVPIEEIRKVNPELKDGLKIGQELVIPLPPKQYKEHKVMAGETLYSLALNYGVPIPEIKKLNPELDAQDLKVGMVIRIPNQKKSDSEPSAEDRARLTTQATAVSGDSAAMEDFTSGEYHVHKVEAKQTAYSLSKKYHISLDSLYLLNPGAEGGLRIGQLLKLPKNRARYSDQNLVQNQPDPKEELARDNREPGSEKGDSTEGFFLYKVKTGDSFYSFKSRFNVSREELVKLNPELSSGLTVDQYIIIPKKEEEEVDVSWLDKIFKDVEAQPEPVGTPGQEKVSRKDSLNRGLPSEPSKDILEDTLKIDVSRQYRVGVMLPFFAGTDTSFNYDTEVPQRSHYVLDFYNGLLMAAETLAAQGMNLSLHVYDTRNSLFTLGEKKDEIRKANYDMVIGPLFQKNVEYMADQLRDKNTPVISPLSKTVDVTNRPNLVKSVPDSESGVWEIADLINANFSNARIVFAHSNTAEDKEKVRQIKARLLPRHANSFVENVVFTQDVLASGEIREIIKEDKPNVIVVLSEDKVFLSDLVGRLRTMRNRQVTVIGPPKLLQIPTVDMDYLNGLKLTMTDASFIDYSDEATLRFIEEYRNRYGNEPGQIAFQGYDVGLYFLTKLWKYGPYLLQTINEEETLLNTGFRIVKTEGGGYRNEYLHIVGIRDFTLVRIPLSTSKEVSTQLEN